LETGQGALFYAGRIKCLLGFPSFKMRRRIQ
jgi:hypothetical protein